MLTNRLFLLSTVTIVSVLSLSPVLAGKLHKAAEKGNLHEVERLITNGADVNSKDRKKHNWTALHIAILEGHDAVVELLIAKGADANTKDEKGRTPLFAAANRGNKAVAELLIAAGANVNAKSMRSTVPLGAAVFRGHAGVAELLITKGADVNAQSADGTTPLHLAAHIGHTALAELLIANGADINVTDRKGRTPLDLAKQKGNDSLVELLAGTKVVDAAEKPIIDKTKLTTKYDKALAQKEESKKARMLARKSEAEEKAKRSKTEDLAKAQKKEGTTPPKKRTKTSQKAIVEKKAETHLIKSGQVTEIRSYDSYGLYHTIDLYNKKGAAVAKKIMLRSQYNPTQITGILIKDKSGKQIHYTDVEVGGNVKNRLWVCLDKEGNIIKKSGASLLVKPFQALQKTQFEIKYKGAFRDKKITKFSPCSNCAEKTGNQDCEYVW